MKSFRFSQAVLDKKAQQKIESKVSQFGEIGAIITFTNASVYLTEQLFSGNIVLTGPSLAYHLFVNRGLTKKYIGELDISPETGEIIVSRLLRHFNSPTEQRSAAAVISEFNVFAIRTKEYLEKKDNVAM